MRERCAAHGGRFRHPARPGAERYDSAFHLVDQRRNHVAQRHRGSRLAYLAFAFALHRLLKEFDWSDDEGDEEDDFERLAESLEGIRASVEERDPLPFSGNSVWPAVLDDMAAGMWS
ncbi:hypothetical protein ACH41H_12950 [Streptomyces sp. NPDC020800]|uniref:hypothetical protein n=1 Tax=Streptomyces sp. NPDC020800 TaxID=3365092 RepID=UPI0037A76977